MKIIAPIKRNTDKSIDIYKAECCLQLIVFKKLLKDKLQTNKLKCRQEDLFYEPNIHWTISEPKYDITAITNSFINNLRCEYDTTTDTCYYMVPIRILCPYTTTSLNKVIRILEYGGYNLAPLYWIRLAYREFVETINNNNFK